MYKPLTDLFTHDEDIQMTSDANVDRTAYFPLLIKSQGKPILRNLLNEDASGQEEIIQWSLVGSALGTRGLGFSEAEQHGSWMVYRESL